LIGPKGLPQAVVERVNRDIGKTLHSREIEARMQADGVSPAGSTPEALRARIQSEVPMWKSVVSRARIKLE
jgi:tripartite-type tricarboxylate transporter receptor subunit TctC